MGAVILIEELQILSRGKMVKGVIRGVESRHDALAQTEKP